MQRHRGTKTKGQGEKSLLKDWVWRKQEEDKGKQKKEFGTDTGKRTHVLFHQEFYGDNFFSF